MDIFVKGLLIVYKLLEDEVFENFIKERYVSFSEGIGKDIVEGKVGFKELEFYVL